MNVHGLKVKILLTIVLFAVLSSSARATNRFRIEDEQLAIGSTGNVVGVLADLDQETVGLSIRLQFDPARIRIAAVRAGTGLLALEPEFSEGFIDNEAGEVVHGVVLSLGGAIVESRIAPGEGVELLQLVVVTRAILL